MSSSKNSITDEHVFIAVVLPKLSNIIDAEAQEFIRKVLNSSQLVGLVGYPDVTVDSLCLRKRVILEEETKFVHVSLRRPPPATLHTQACAI